MPTAMKWFMILALTTVTSVVSVEKSSATEMLGKKPILISLHNGLRSQGYGDRDLKRTISVLESKIGGRQLPKPAIDKLAAMNEEERRLVTLLCDRIAQSGDGPGPDVALVLVAAMIVLT
jgi:hypothetical protein